MDSAVVKMHKNALRRTKTTCDSRSVMWATHLQVLAHVEAPKEDPTSFRRYAEKIQAHLLNLSCIDESSHADIIENLTKKLHIQHRLSWNGGRRGGLELQTMNEFGV